jgi:hypothetical protein
MNTHTEHTQNSAEELRQAARRLGDGAAYVAKTIPWVAIAKGTGKLAINILRYSMGIAIYGLVILPYRLFAGFVGTGAPEADQYREADSGVWEDDPYEGSYRTTHAFTDDGPIVPVYVNQETNSYSSGDDVMDYRVR